MNGGRFLVSLREVLLQKIFYSLARTLKKNKHFGRRHFNKKFLLFEFNLQMSSKTMKYRLPYWMTCVAHEIFGYAAKN